MANSVSQVDFLSETLAQFLAKGTSNGTIDDLITASKQRPVAGDPVSSKKRDDLIDDFVLEAYPLLRSVTSGLPNFVALSGDVVNNNATPNTIADVTGLSFAVTAGQTYWFRFTIGYTSANTGTGSRWTINGPAAPTYLAYHNTWQPSGTANSNRTTGSYSAYDLPAACSLGSLLTGNVALIEGLIKPSVDGTVIARFASEVANSAITAKAGSVLQWIRTL